MTHSQWRCILDALNRNRLLVAPLSHRALHISHSPTGCALVADGEPLESFLVLLDIPVLIPPGLLADWDHNVLEVVLGARTRTVVGAAHAQHGVTDAAIHAVATWIRDSLGIDGVRDAVRHYRQRQTAERLRWQPTGIDANGRPASPVRDDELKRARTYATRDNGTKRVLQAQQCSQTWGFHLPDFQRRIASVGARAVVELGCGAGVGTYWIAEAIDRDADLYAVDVDFVCAANCLGMREATDRVDRLHPVVASFWHLPFPDSSIDLVCSHYGIDETREVTVALREVSRVLRPGGHMVSVSRTDPALRMKTYLGELGLSDAELTIIAQEADLYGGPDHFTSQAAECGLQTVKAISMQHHLHHERTVFDFRKA